MINFGDVAARDSRTVAILEAPDPVAAFKQAHQQRQLLALPTSGTISRTGRTVLRSTDSWLGSFTEFDAAFHRITGQSSTGSWWIPGRMNATMNLFAGCFADWLGVSYSHSFTGQEIAALTPAGLADVVSERRHPGLRVAVVAGAALSPALAAAAQQVGISTLHYYGASELSLVAVGAHADDLRPFAGVDIEIRDDVIWVRSPWVSQGYLEDSLSRDGDWLSVGDLGAMQDGMLRVWGRSEAVNIGGMTVLLASLETRFRQAAAELGAVRGEFALAGIPHPQFGQILAAGFTDAADLSSLRKWARENLDGPDRPRLWGCVEELPLTPAGKLDRTALAGLLRKGGQR